MILVYVVVKSYHELQTFKSAFLSWTGVILNEIKLQSIQNLLDTKKLRIPSYQRPYKWSKKNIEELLADIEIALKKQKELNNSNFKYRVGTILLHNNKEDNTLDVIDGQQRIVSFFLLQKYLKPNKTNFIDMKLENNSTKFHLCENYAVINDWFSLQDNQYKSEILKAFNDLLEVVVITVQKQEEAFQLFDSQNSRGKALYPHDLLKAYHLREMNNDLFEMQRVVESWEEMDCSIKNRKNKSENKIEDLFDDYLFPILNWSEKEKTWPFTTDDIDSYKGIKRDCPYPYAMRTEKAMPIFQITEPIVAGKDFFDMVHYYLPLLEYLKKVVFERYPVLKKIMDNHDDGGAGYCHCKNLFYCVLLAYYDRFKNLDEKVVKKLFSWAFMLRVDRWSLSYASINKYAVGERGDTTNAIPLFYCISHATKHTQIANISIKVKRENDQANKADSWNNLYAELKKLNGVE